MKTTHFNPIELIHNQYGLKDGYNFTHVSYDKAINDNFDYQIIRRSKHDGTLIFTDMLLNEVVHPIVMKQSIYARQETKGLKDIAYIIGYLKLESEYSSNSVIETAYLPVKCVCKFDQGVEEK